MRDTNLFRDYHINTTETDSKNPFIRIQEKIISARDQRASGWCELDADSSFRCEVASYRIDDYRTILLRDHKLLQEALASDVRDDAALKEALFCYAFTLERVFKLLARVERVFLHGGLTLHDRHILADVLRTENLRCTSRYGARSTFDYDPFGGDNHHTKWDYIPEMPYTWGQTAPSMPFLELVLYLRCISREITGSMISISKDRPVACKELARVLKTAMDSLSKELATLSKHLLQASDCVEFNPVVVVHLPSLILGCRALWLKVTTLEREIFCYKV